MSKQHAPRDEIEAELRSLRPRQPSSELLGRISSRIGSAPSTVGRPARHYLRWAVVAVACSILVGLSIWLARRGSDPPGREGQDIADSLPKQECPEMVHQAVAIASGWRIEPTGKAEFSVLKPDCIRLVRGELLVESVALADRKQQRPALSIETPVGKATATGTKFYVGTYPLEPAKSPQSKGNVMSMSSLTRVLVLTGVVTLVNAQGSVTGQANHLLAAETGKAPVNHAITANSDFAVDLYRELAKENPGKNMFFSPYSMSGALAMTAEGARGETAAQMGKVLRFPEAARHVGDEAQMLPWNTAMIHSGLADLLDRYTPKPASPELRQKIDSLRKQLDASKAQEQKPGGARKGKQHKQQVAESGKLPAELAKYIQQVAESRKLAAELAKLSSQVDQYELRVANALWGEKSYHFQQPYLDTIHKFYGTGGLFPVDFKGNFEGERLKINAWVEEQTNQRIKDLLPQGSLTESTRLVLTNAIYFKGEWQEQFDEKMTQPKDFTVAAGTKVQVPMMCNYGMTKARYGAFNADGSFFPTPRMTGGRSFGTPQTTHDSKQYPDKGGFLVAELPYKGGDLSMVVMVPQDAKDLPELEKKLSSANINTWLGKLEGRSVHVYLPKFRLETEYQEMADTLKSLGMVRAFNDPRNPTNGAQFDGMSVSQNSADKLYISKVCHKAFVEVNEKGTEAAAATGVVMAAPISASIDDSPFTPTFRADKPFVAAIRDMKTGAILFLGRMTNPNG